MKVSQKSAKQAFVLVELLCLIFCIFVILLFPIKAFSKAEPRAHVCVSNARQMVTAWSQSADDNNGLLPVAETSSGVPNPALRGYFAPVVVSYSTNPQNWDPERSVALSVLAPYINDYSIWRCPSDMTTVLDGTTRKPRVRSISMNQAFGAGFWLPAGAYRVYSDRSQIMKPARTFVTIDEHPDSINDGGFAVAMAEPGATSARIVDFPASFHYGGATMTFADGRAEIHKWKGRRIKPPVRYNNSLSLNLDAGDSVGDIIWLSRHTTVSR